MGLTHEDMQNPDKVGRDSNAMLERLVHLIEGDGSDAPGLLARVSLIERLMFGKEAEGGMVQRVAFMWKSWIWVMCSVSAALGFLVRELIRILWHV